MRKFSLTKSNSGTTAIEFAVIAPVLFFLTMAIVEIGLMRFTQGVLTAAVGKAIENTENIPANVNGCGQLNNTSITSQFGTIANLIIDPSRLHVITQNSAGVTSTVSLGEATLINVTYDWLYFTPFFSSVAGSNGFTIRVSNSYYRQKC
jgi:Flp pilus assembly protein TadG